MNKMRSASCETSSLSMNSASTTLGEIVVFPDGSSDSAAILKFAAELAQIHAARLISVFIQPEPSLTTAQGFARGQGVRDMVDLQQKQLEGLEASHRQSFEDLARRHGIRSEWRSLSHFNTEVGVHAYYADLVVIARGPHRRPDWLGGIPRAELRPAHSSISSGQHSIPHSAHRGGVERHTRICPAASDAVPLLARAESVEILVVDDKRHPGHGQEPGADIARHLARHGARVEVRRASSSGQDVGRFLLSQAAAFRADLLVMGAYGHSQVREWMFGSITRTVLYEAVVPVLMSR